MAQNTRVNLSVYIDGPHNLNPVVATVKRAFSGLNAGPNAGIDPASARNAATVASAVTNLQGQLNGAASSAAALDKALARSGRGPTSNFQALNGQLRQTQTELDRTQAMTGKATSEMYRFGQQAALSGRRMLAFGLGAVSFIKVAGAIQGAAKESIDFEQQMIRVAQLGASSKKEIQGVADTIDTLSRNLGVSSKELADATIYLKGAGLNTQEVNSALSTLAKTSLAPTFKDIRSTTEGLLSMRSQFKLTASDYESAFGAINAVSKEFATESEDIIEAVRRGGASFRAASGDITPMRDQLHQFIGLFNSVRSATRESAESIGTSFRTIFSRLQTNEVNESLKEMGINLRHTAEDAKLAGQNIEGQFVGGYEAIKRISDATRNIPSTDPRFAAIVQQVGGSRQSSKVIPLLKEFETAQKTVSVAQAGANSLTTDSEKAQDAFANKLSKVHEEFVSLAREVQQSKFMQQLLDLFIKGAQAATFLARSLSPLIPLLTGIAAAKIGMGALQFGKGFVSPPPVAVSRIRRAQGGIVPGGYPNDSFYTQLPANSFVIRSQVARRLHPETKRGLVSGRGGHHHGHMVDVALTSHEVVVPPETVKRVGKGRLHAINAGHYATGGSVFRGIPEHRIVKNFVERGTSERGRAFAPFYESYRKAIPLEGDDRRRFNEIYASQSFGTRDKSILSKSVDIYKRHKQTGSVDPEHYHDLLRPLAANVPNRKLLLGKVFRGESVTTPKLGSYLRGLEDPNYFPIDRNVLSAAYGQKSATKEQLKISPKERKQLARLVNRAAKHAGMSGQEMQAALFAHQSKFVPRLHDTIDVLGRLAGPHARGGIVGGVRLNASIGRMSTLSKRRAASPFSHFLHRAVGGSVRFGLRYDSHRRPPMGIRRDSLEWINNRTWFHGSPEKTLTPGSVRAGDHMHGDYGPGLFTASRSEIADWYRVHQGHGVGTLYRAKANLSGKIINLSRRKIDPTFSKDLVDITGEIETAHQKAGRGTIKWETGHDHGTFADFHNSSRFRSNDNLTMYQQAVAIAEYGGQGLGIPRKERTRSFTRALRERGYDAITHSVHRHPDGTPLKRPGQALAVLDPNDAYSKVGRTGQFPAFEPAGYASGGIVSGRHRPWRDNVSARRRRKFVPANVDKDAKLEDRFLKEYFISGVESPIIGRLGGGKKYAFGGSVTSPNPIDIRKLYLSRQHNNAGRARRYSVDPTRLKWYAQHRAARFGDALRTGRVGEHADMLETRMARYEGRKHSIGADYNRVRYARGGAVRYAKRGAHAPKGRENYPSWRIVEPVNRFPDLPKISDLDPHDYDAHRRLLAEKMNRLGGMEMGPAAGYATGGAVLSPLRKSRYNIDQIRRRVQDTKNAIDPHVLLASKLKAVATKGGHRDIGHMMVALRATERGGNPVGFGRFAEGGEVDDDYFIHPKFKAKIPHHLQGNDEAIRTRLELLKGAFPGAGRRRREAALHTIGLGDIASPLRENDPKLTHKQAIRILYPEPKDIREYEMRRGERGPKMRGRQAPEIPVEEGSIDFLSQVPDRHREEFNPEERAHAVRADADLSAYESTSGQGKVALKKKLAPIYGEREKPAVRVKVDTTPKITAHKGLVDLPPVASHLGAYYPQSLANISTNKKSPQRLIDLVTATRQAVKNQEYSFIPEKGRQKTPEFVASHVAAVRSIAEQHGYTLAPHEALPGGGIRASVHPVVPTVRDRASDVYARRSRGLNIADIRASNKPMVDLTKALKDNVKEVRKQVDTTSDLTEKVSTVPISYGTSVRPPVGRQRISSVHKVRPEDISAITGLGIGGVAESVRNVHPQGEGFSLPTAKRHVSDPARVNEQYEQRMSSEQDIDKARIARERVQDEEAFLRHLETGPDLYARNKQLAQQTRAREVHVRRNRGLSVDDIRQAELSRRNPAVPETEIPTQRALPHYPSRHGTLGSIGTHILPSSGQVISLPAPFRIPTPIGLVPEAMPPVQPPRPPFVITPDAGLEEAIGRRGVHRHSNLPARAPHEATAPVKVRTSSHRRSDFDRVDKGPFDPGLVPIEESPRAAHQYEDYRRKIAEERKQTKAEETSARNNQAFLKRQSKGPPKRRQVVDSYAIGDIGSGQTPPKPVYRKESTREYRDRRTREAGGIPPAQTVAEQVHVASKPLSEVEATALLGQAGPKGLARTPDFEARRRPSEPLPDITRGLPIQIYPEPARVRFLPKYYPSEVRPERADRAKKLREQQANDPRRQEALAYQYLNPDPRPRRGSRWMDNAKYDASLSRYRQVRGHDASAPTIPLPEDEGYDVGGFPASMPTTREERDRFRAAGLKTTEDKDVKPPRPIGRVGALVRRVNPQRWRSVPLAHAIQTIPGFAERDYEQEISDVLPTKTRKGAGGLVDKLLARKTLPDAGKKLYEQALQGDANIVLDKRNRIRDVRPTTPIAPVQEGLSPFRQRIVNFVSPQNSPLLRRARGNVNPVPSQFSAFANAVKPQAAAAPPKNRLDKLKGAGIGVAAVAGSFAPQIIQQATGNFGDRGVNNARVKAGRQLGGAIQGATTGAFVGSLAGPWGIALGASVGLLHGFATATKEATEELHNMDLDKSLGKLDAAIGDIISGKSGITPEAISQVSQGLGGLDKAESEKNVRNTNFQDNMVGRFLHSVSGAGGTVGADARVAGRRQFTKENIEPRVGQFRAFNEAIAKNIDLKSVNPELLKTKDARGNPLSEAQLTSNREARIAEFKRRGGADVAAKVVEATPGLTFEKYYREIDKVILEANREESAHQTLTKAIAAQEIQTRQFLRIGQAIDNTIDHFHDLQRGLDVLEASFNNQLAPEAVHSHVGALQNVGGLDTAAFEKGVEYVTRGLSSGTSLTRQASENFKGPYDAIHRLAEAPVDTTHGVISDLGQTALGINKAANVLPQVLADAGSGGLDTDQITNQVSKSLGAQGIPEAVTKKIVNLLGSMKPEEISKAVADNVQKLADSLIKDGFGNVNEVLVNAAKALEERANAYNAGLVKNQEMISRIGDMQDEHANLQVQALQSGANIQAELAGRSGQAQLPVGELMQPLEFRQHRLTGLEGEDAHNPQVIAAKLRNTETEIAATRHQRETNTFPEGEDAAAAKLEKLKGSAQNLTKALEDLAHPVQKNAILQEKLNRIEASRNSKLSYVERAVAAGPAEQFHMQRNQQFAAQAVANQSFVGLNHIVRQGALQHLDSLGEAEIPEYGGKKASDVKKQLLVNTGLQIGRINPKDERDRIGLMQDIHGNDKTAIQAQEKLIGHQETLQTNFFRDLHSMQEEFFNRLATDTLKAQKKDVGVQQADATVKYGKAETAGKAAQYFQKLGFTPEEAQRANQANLGGLTETLHDRDTFKQRHTQVQADVLAGRGEVGALSTSAFTGDEKEKDKNRENLTSKLQEHLNLKSREEAEKITRDTEEGIRKEKEESTPKSGFFGHPPSELQIASQPITPEAVRKHLVNAIQSNQARQGGEIGSQIQGHVGRIHAAIEGTTAVPTQADTEKYVKLAGANPVELGNNLKAFEGFSSSGPEGVRGDIRKQALAAQDKHKEATELEKTTDTNLAELEGQGKKIRQRREEAVRPIPATVAEVPKPPLPKPPVFTAPIKREGPPVQATRPQLSSIAAQPEPLMLPPMNERQYNSYVAQRQGLEVPQPVAAGPQVKPKHFLRQGTTARRIANAQTRRKGPAGPGKLVQTPTGPDKIGAPTGPGNINAPAVQPAIGPQISAEPLMLPPMNERQYNAYVARQQAGEQTNPNGVPVERLVADVVPIKKPRKRLVDVLKENPKLRPTSLTPSPGDRKMVGAEYDPGESGYSIRPDATANAKVGAAPVFGMTGIRPQKEDFDRVAAGPQGERLAPDLVARNKAAKAGFGLPVTSPLIAANTPEVGQSYIVAPKSVGLETKPTQGQGKSPVSYEDKLRKRNERQARGETPDVTPTVTNAQEAQKAQPPTTKAAETAKPADPMAAFGQNVQALGTIMGGFDKSITNFSAALSNLATVFKDVKIPEKISLESNGKVEVILNGAQLLATIKGDTQKYVVETIAEEVKKLRADVPNIVKEAT